MPKNRNFNNSVWLILYSKPLDLKCMKWIKSTLCWDCYTKINLFYCIAHLWVQKTGRPCSIEDARTLYVKYVCRNHFLETDFTAPERKRLKRGAVPCSSDSASQEPTPQLPDSALSDLNSLPSLLSPQKNLHVQPPSFRIERLWQCMILHTSWSAPGIFSSNMMCSLSLSAFTTGLLSLQSGNTF